jgi:hypothetical protein
MTLEESRREARTFAKAETQESGSRQLRFGLLAFTCFTETNATGVAMESAGDPVKRGSKSKRQPPRARYE